MEFELPTQPNVLTDNYCTSFRYVGSRTNKSFLLIDIFLCHCCILKRKVNDCIQWLQWLHATFAFSFHLPSTDICIQSIIYVTILLYSGYPTHSQKKTVMKILYKKVVIGVCMFLCTTSWPQFHTKLYYNASLCQKQQLLNFRISSSYIGRARINTCFCSNALIFSWLWMQLMFYA